MKNLLRALRYRNYRLFFAGQSISLIGTWMQNVAMAWLVYRLTKSPFLLGLVGFSAQIPALLLIPFAGVLVDRYNRYRILLITELLAMVQAFIFAAFIIAGFTPVWLIILLGIILGVINAFDMPARQSFVVEMVEKKEDLGNAIALNSSMVNGARLIGPPVAGILIALVGEGVCFLLNGLSYIAVVMSLVSMRLKPRRPKADKKGMIKELKEGFFYVYNSVPIRDILLLLSVVSLVGMPYAVLMPIVAKEILGGGPQTLGLLMAASGSGALVGALYLASRKNVIGLSDIIPKAAGLFGLGLAAFSFSTSLSLSIILLVMVGFGMMVQMASSNTLLQTIVDDNKRGRVMSLFMMAFVGMAPFGCLFAGMAASTFGVLHTILFSGIFCVFCGMLFWFRLPVIKKQIHPIYLKMGIIPGIADGIEVVAELKVPPAE